MPDNSEVQNGANRESFRFGPKTGSRFFAAFVLWLFCVLSFTPNLWVIGATFVLWLIYGMMSRARYARYVAFGIAGMILYIAAAGGALLWFVYTQDYIPGPTLGNPIKVLSAFLLVILAAPLLLVAKVIQVIRNVMSSIVD